MVFRAQRLVTGIGNDETAGAVGALRHAVAKAGLPDQGRLLVPGDAANRHLAADAVAGRNAEVRGTIPHLGQHLPRH